MDILNHAAELLSGAPWNWRATVEYPGFLQVTFDDGGGDVRAYAAGFANDTLTVDPDDATNPTATALWNAAWQAAMPALTSQTATE